MLNIGRNGDISSPSIALCATAAVFTYFKVSSQVPNRVSLPAECCAWGLIWLFAKLSRSINSSSLERDGKAANSLTLAVCAVLAFACERAAPVETIAPLLSPLLLIISHKGRSPDSPKLSSVETLLKIVTNLPDTTFIASSAIATVILLRAVDHGPSVLTGTIHLTLLLLIFGNMFGFTHPRSERGPSNGLLEQISLRIVALLGICMCVGHQQIMPLSAWFGLGVSTRAAFWIALLELKIRGHAVAAASIYAFGVQIAYIHKAGSSNGAAILCGLSLFMLWHPLSGLRSLSGSKRLSAILSIFPLLSLFFIRYHSATAIHDFDTSFANLYASKSMPHHPIAKLVEEATIKAAALEFNQSMTLEQAVSRYKQDFNHAPPPKFDAWFAFAQQHDALIDSYQAVTRSIHALYPFSPAELRRAVEEAAENGDSNSVLISIKNGLITASSAAEHFMTTGVMQWLEHPLPKCAPDVDFLLNVLDEPRVLISQKSIKNQRKGSKVEFLNLSRKSLVTVAQEACPPKLQAQATAAKNDSPDSWFIKNMTAATNACQDPSLFSLHGLFECPDTAKITQHALPIFSPAGTSPFSDILIPSPWYQLMADMHDYNVKDDMAWTKKENLLYWSGRSTGGYATPENWRQLHRQRFVDGVNNATKEVYILSQNTDGHSASDRPMKNSEGQEKEINRAWKWITSTSSRIGLQGYFNVRLTGDPVQCETSACDQERSHFHMADPVPMHDAYRAKLVIDIDGNSFSGRFHRLLTSQSTVLKQTIFQEWHDDRLVPWAHYIPVSMHMNELPEIVRFLLETEEGQGLALKIARQGSRWARIALRPEDLKVAFYRVLLEYAWLMSDERVPSSS